MASRKRAFLQGAKDMSPILLGVAPFGLIAGIAAVSVGLSLTEAIGMSLIIYAGASQLAALELINQQAAMPVIILTALIINLRFTIYSASLAPHFRDLPLAWKSPLAYCLTDQAYAIAISAFTRDDDLPCKPFYYFGAAGSMWATWQVAVVAGALLGAQVPVSWHLEFAIPLTFLALLVPAIKDRPAAWAAVTAGVVVLLAKPLPFNLGLFAAALVGITAGYMAEKRVRHAA
jgi:4-azaleucine resistance transporter AzlC